MTPFGCMNISDNKKVRTPTKEDEVIFLGIFSLRYTTFLSLSIFSIVAT